MFKGRALVLHKRFLRDENGNEFGFAQLHHGETFDRLGELVPLAFAIVSDGEAQAITHEVDVSLDGLGRDLYVASQTRPVGKITRFDSMEYPLHPIQRRSGKESLSFAATDRTWTHHVPEA